MRRIDPLTQAITRERNCAHAQGYHIGNTGLISRDSGSHSPPATPHPVLASPVVTQDKVLRRAYQRLCSVTGIAQTSALRILAEVVLLPEDMKPAQWVAHAGLDPKPKQSGTANPSRRISKTGNKYLRHACLVGKEARGIGPRNATQRRNANAFAVMQGLSGVLKQILSHARSGANGSARRGDFLILRG